MEEFFLKIYHQYGIFGVAFAYFFLDKFIWPKVLRWKKGDGYVGYEVVLDVKERIGKVEAIINGSPTKQEILSQVERVIRHQSATESKLDVHLEKEAQEDIDMGIMKNELTHQRGEIVELKQDVKSIDRTVGEIKALLIESLKSK